MKKNDETVATVKAGEQHAELEATFSNNTDVGTGEVTVKAKSGSKKFSGQIKANFEIRPASGKVIASDFSSLERYLAKGAYTKVALGADVEIPQNKTVEIFPATTLDMNGYNLVNRGELINRGSIAVKNINADNDEPNLVNYGRLVNDSQNRDSILLGANAALINHGEYSGEGRIHYAAFTGCYIFSDRQGTHFNVSSSVITVKYREDINDAEQYILDSDEFDYCAAPCEPKLMLNLLHPVSVNETEYTVTYQNNVRAGKATATFTAIERSASLYGTRTFEFTINKSVAQVSTAAQLQTALADENYRGVTVVSAQPFELNEEISVLPNVELTLPESIVNGNVALAQGSALKLSGKTLVRGGVTGQGVLKIDEQAEVYFASDASEPTVSIVNDGAAYANFALSGVTGGGATTLRRQLSAAEITSKDLRYNGNPQEADIAFSNQDENGYVVSYKHEESGGTIWNGSLYAARGAYEARVEFTEYDKHYFGVTVFGFEIVRGTADVDGQSALDAAIASDNYDRYVADTLTLSDTDMFTVPADVTVTANKLVSGGEVIVYGNLIVEGSVENKDGARITVGASGKLVCAVLNNLAPTELIKEDGGVLEASEKAYFCDEDNPAVTGNCTRYVRRNLANATFENVAEAKFGVNTKPAFELHLNGQALAELEKDCEIEYRDDRYRTVDATAKIIVTATDTSELFYGEAQHHYAVAAGEIDVFYQTMLSNALKNVNPEGLCNYEKVTVISEIVLSNPSNINIDMKVRSGCTLLIKAPISWELGERRKNKYAFGNEGKIEIYHTGTLPERDSNYTWEGDITAYVSSDDDIYNANYYRIGHIVVVSNIYSARTDLRIQAERNDVTVELNGYDLNMQLTLTYYSGHTLTFSNGSVANLKVTKGTYGDDVGKIVLNNVQRDRYTNSNNAKVEIN